MINGPVETISLDSAELPDTRERLPNQSSRSLTAPAVDAGFQEHRPEFDDKQSERGCPQGT